MSRPLATPLRIASRLPTSKLRNKRFRRIARDYVRIFGLLPANRTIPQMRRSPAVVANGLRCIGVGRVF